MKCKLWTGKVQGLGLEVRVPNKIDRQNREIGRVDRLNGRNRSDWVMKTNFILFLLEVGLDCCGVHVRSYNWVGDVCGGGSFS